MYQEQRPPSPPSAGRDDDARRARLDELRRQDERRLRRGKRLRAGATIGGALAAVALVLSLFASLHGRPAPSSAEDSGIDPDRVNVPGETLHRDLQRGHVKGDVDYPADVRPPVGGPHDPRWQNANGDVYTRPLREENAVHALEHGAVWVTYSGELPQAEVEKLRAKVAGVPYRMMSPLPDQESPVRLTAWGHQLSVESAADERVDAFFDAYVQGPQAPEQGAPVTGGKETP
ncbi:DUF3105 domain-containing protein [Streptomyces sp. NPDC059874]|uniref:DUF3105 domain-containing protein n=1 Tax=Streptomyces sp. NPDC059874 TaxID=3346983 RepID=UPI003660DACD